MIGRHCNRLMLMAGMLVFMALPGCQLGHPQDRARRALKQELEQREAQRARADQLYEEGLRLYEQDEVDQAQRLLADAVEVDERHAPAWLALGVVETDRHRLFDAAYAFEQVAQLRPTRYEPHYNVGHLFESIGRYPQAAKAYEKALALAPDRVEIMENLAHCYIAMGRHSNRTRELIDRALALETRPDWRQWLREQRETFNVSDETLQ